MELKVTNLDRNTEGNIVTVIHWTAIKTDGDYTASVYNTQSVEVGDTVIPYADLTEEVVKGWLAEKLDLESLESALDAQIEAQKNPVTASGLPW